MGCFTLYPDSPGLCGHFKNMYDRISRLQTINLPVNNQEPCSGLLYGKNQFSYSTGKMCKNIREVGLLHPDSSRLEVLRNGFLGLGWKKRGGRYKVARGHRHCSSKNRHHLSIFSKEPPGTLSGYEEESARKRGRGLESEELS